ncbi:alpha/beta fold hydrolase [Seonamhaeicola marinus]|uniref:Alpha/beta hydrolase n=1 Tax=Seonamhaeicola marinus TaxID=1912246 RepID=A0A5D0HS40_9FLAO|nr:alpha/beta hydrolase [Seonamhaeicola marinus]TYA74098.1 alpha/beta hydrolase [Seonamhaeicola marinus]
MKTIRRTLVVAIILLNTTLYAQTTKAFEVKVVGKGEPVLLFPGFTCTGDVWNALVEELSKTKECHIFTLAGFGGVPAIEKPWLPKVKEGISNYISENKLESSTLIGHSLGGSIALWLATENNTFKKIIVVDALPSVGALMMPNFNKDHIVYDNPYNKQLLEMNETQFDAMANQFATAMSLNKQKQPQIKQWILDADRETYVYGYTDLLKLDLREAISKIEVPVLVLAATHPYGENTVKNTYGAQYKNLKNYKITFAKDAAHFIMFDQPEWFLNTIKTEML